jgi:hypothetical protein
MQTGSSGTLIGWKSGQTTFVPLWDRMEGAWLRTQGYVIPEVLQTGGAPTQHNHKAGLASGIQHFTIYLRFFNII